MGVTESKPIATPFVNELEQRSAAQRRPRLPLRTSSLSKDRIRTRGFR